MLFLSKKSSHLKKVKIGELLVKKKIISEAQLQQALLSQNQTGKKLGDILIAQGAISNHQLKQALNAQYWQNLTATLFVSVSALSGTSSHIAVAQFTSNVRPTEAQSINKFQDNNSYFSDNRTSKKSVIANEISNLESNSLAANSQPTERNPLTGFLYPFNHYRPMSQAYNGTTHRGRMYYARDLAAAIGTPVFAMRSGTIVGVEDRFPDTGGGRENISKFNYVWIEHEGGYRSAYLHLQQGFTSSIRIKVGDRVRGGQLIGFSGNSGWSSGPHLHIEVHKYDNNNNFGQTVPFNLSMWSPSRVAQR